MKKLMLVTAMTATMAVGAVNAGTNNLPANYKRVALTAVKNGLKDPDSVRTLRLSSMAPIDMGNGETCVIVEVNAKNSFGGYTGVVPVGVYFKDGRVLHALTLNMP